MADDATLKTSSVRAKAEKELVRFTDEAQTRLGKGIEKMQSEVDGATREVTEKATELGKQFKRMHEDAEGMLAGTLEAGERLAKLEPIQSAYRFISEGKGDLTEREIFPITIGYLGSLNKWEEDRRLAQGALYYGVKDLEKAIDELNVNYTDWLKSEE